MASPVQPVRATAMRELKWSPSEKAIARKAFNLAIGREMEAVIRETKKRAARIEEAEGLWALERYLTQHREEIDRKYDYRYSVLPLVFASLIRDGLLSEEDLDGIGEDKLRYIRLAVSL